MITGVVRGYEGRLRLRIRGPHGHEQEVEAVIDTGYSAWLSLRPGMIAALGLAWKGIDRSMLADGTVTLFHVYKGTVIWDGRARRISIDQADTDPLVGMGLLKGYELKMQVRARSKVTIKRLP
jgi:clan AA aspartic protease